MYAILFTPNYEVLDLEKVGSFNVRKGEEFQVRLLDVEPTFDVFTNNDPSLSLAKPEFDGAILPVNIKATSTGTTLMRVYDGSTLVKEWAITVYDQRATSLGITTGEPTIK